MTELRTARGTLRLPAFLPDGTRAVVRTVDSLDLERCGVRGLMVNALHLSATPGLSVVSSAGGIHRFMGWRGLVATDSGGFQVFSLVEPGLASVSPHGFSFRVARGKPRQRLTPEGAVSRQLKAGADILFCLDHCTHPEADAAVQRESVENTVRWARAGRAAFDRVTASREADTRPLLYAVVQGGNDPALRRECAERLLEIGFSGFGFGGWPIGSDGRLLDMVATVASMLPHGTLLHGLGIGKPENVVAGWRAGYHTFDCVIPTRDARHRRLFLFSGPVTELDLDDPDFYATLYLDSPRLMRDHRPIEDGCDCPCCARFSRAYLRHLNSVRDPLAMRLATLHNLRFYSRLVERLAEGG